VENEHTILGLFQQDHGIKIKFRARKYDWRQVAYCGNIVITVAIDIPFDGPLRIRWQFTLQHKWQ